MDNKIVKIEIDGDDVTFWFADSDEPFSASEFKIGSHTRDILELIERLVTGQEI